MAKREFVDGESYISDDSDFYGDEGMKTKYQDLASSRQESEYHPPVPFRVLKKLKHFDAEPICHNGRGVSSSETEPEIKSEPKSDQDVLSFLKSRPQINTLEKERAKNKEPAKLEKPRTLDGKRADDRVKVDCFNGRPDSWQQSEKIEDFLRRLPVSDPATANVGPWLWVGSPTVPYAHSLRRKPERTGDFIDGGTELLQSFCLQRGKIEGDNPGKAPATITRKLAPYRDQLEIDLLTFAVKTGVTSGKWMLFPNPSDLARVWHIVATATADAKLGPVSKVGTFDPDKASTLICIYTHDFSDFEDVHRVLNEIVDLELCHADGKPLYYKCDAYTDLDISSNNAYKLRASVYSSKEILHNEVKALANGPVARMKKPSSKKMTDFFQAFAGDDIS